jgi:TRAP-type C4-dicarboxylate transport system permease small subunit
VVGEPPSADRNAAGAQALARAGLVWLGRVLDIAIVALVAAVVAITFAQVLARYVIEASLIWSGEALSLLFVWVVMLAAVRGEHMRITFVAEALPRPLRLASGAVALLVSLGMLGLLGYGAHGIWGLLANDRYVTLPLSPSLLFLAVLVGSILWAVAMLLRIVGGDPQQGGLDPKGVGPKGLESGADRRAAP